ncbi:MAG: hypothetical protein J1F40_10675 [Prevotellaceae bacterium]|nr:hypothetical protein [Prevotellaceae bacterium]
MKQIIWTSETYLDDEARKEYQKLQREYLKDDNYTVSDEEWSEEVWQYLSDERKNLNKEVDGVIIAFADLGLWNGRRQGYKLMGHNIANILRSNDDAEWYGDTYNIRGTMHHHDGTNYVLYRVAKDEDAAQRIADKIYDGEIDEAQFRRMTRSLYPYVAEVYGWKTRRKAGNTICKNI